MSHYFNKSQPQYDISIIFILFVSVPYHLDQWFSIWGLRVIVFGIVKNNKQNQFFMLK